jgi:hypothetical protein
MAPDPVLAQRARFDTRLLVGLVAAEIVAILVTSVTAGPTVGPMHGAAWLRLVME